MTNLDSILKNRDITSPTKVCLVRAMISPVVMYGCESWTIKKAERRRIDAFEWWCWRRPLYSGCGRDSRASSPVETGMSGNFLSCSKGVNDPLEVPEDRCD